MFMHGCFIYLLLLPLLLLLSLLSFLFFIGLFPIIIDSVFTFFYHVTLEYDLGIVIVFYLSFLQIYVFQVKKGLPKLPNEINIIS